MLYGRFIQSKQFDKVALFHDPLKTLKLKTLASHCGNQKGCHDNALAHLLRQVKYVTSFNKPSYLRNLVNH